MRDGAGSQIDRAESCSRRCPISSAFAARPSSSSTAATRWSRPNCATSFAQDIVLLKRRHQPRGRARRRSADRPADRAGSGSSRASCAACGSPTQPTMEAVEMVLQKINKEIVALHHPPRRPRGRPLGQGRRADRRAQDEDDGQRRQRPTDRRSTSAWSARSPRSTRGVLRTLESAGFIPVIAPVGHRPRRRRPTTSTPISPPARSPRRSAPKS